MTTFLRNVIYLQFGILNISTLNLNGAQIGRVKIQFAFPLLTYAYEMKSNSSQKF